MDASWLFFWLSGNALRGSRNRPQFGRFIKIGVLFPNKICAVQILYL